MEKILSLRLAAEESEARFSEIACLIAAELMLPIAERERNKLEGPLQTVLALRRDIHGILAQYDALAMVSGVRPVAGAPAADMRLWADTQRFFRHVRHRYLSWRQVSEAIDLLTSGKRVPLYPDPPRANSLQAEQQKTTEAVFRLLHGFINPASQDKRAIDHGCFADIPLPAAEFAEHAHAAMRIALAHKKSRAFRFLDVGCGGGLKILQAAQFFAVADGLEYDPGYVTAARNLLSGVGLTRSQVFEADALKFSDYGSYDVIYFYRPMREEEALQQLECRIAQQARPGTILIAPYGSFKNRFESLDCAYLEGCIYVVGLDKATAEKLRLAGEQIATVAAPSAFESDPLAGYLMPILEACHANSYPLFWRVN